MAKKKKPQVDYNVRIIDNQDGTFSVGFVSRLQVHKKPKGDVGATWVDGSKRKMEKLLTQGKFLGFA